MKTLLFVIALLMTSCHEQLDYGIVWDEQAAKTQTTKDSLKVELEWYGDDVFMTATVKDKNDQVLAILSKQNGDDICTVIKYLRNDTGAVRGFLVYPGCYPIAERSGNAKIKENKSKELEEYKKMLWKDFDKDNHPNDIGLALVIDEREDRPYAGRYYFRYDMMCKDEIRAIYDPISKQIIKSGDGYFNYDIKTETMEFSRDSLIGDVHLMFVDISNIDCGSHSYKTYCGYRPMEEFDFMSNRMFSHTVFRSDRPEPYVTVELGWDDDGTRYTLSCDYMDHDFATTYSDGVIKREEEISQWGTVLKRDEYIDPGDDNTYSIQFLRYNYQSKQLEDVGTEKIDKTTREARKLEAILKYTRYTLMPHGFTDEELYQIEEAVKLLVELNGVTRMEVLSIGKKKDLKQADLKNFCWNIARQYGIDPKTTALFALNLFYAWFSNTEPSSIQKTLRNTTGKYSIEIDENIIDHLPMLEEKVLGKKHK